MAKFVYALNQSLDGYVDHMVFAPDPDLFRHFVDDMRGLSGVVHGRRMYEVMRYWDEEQPGWDAAERDYAVAWRACPKWVVSRTLDAVGPNAMLVQGEVASALRDLKARLDGIVEVPGPELAASLADWGLVDEYRLYVHPVVLGEGKPLFARARPRLRLVAHERIGADAVRLTYVPA